MTPVLYSSARSPHCFKVSLFLHEKGVAFDRVEIDLRSKQQKTPGYLTINPLGQVPVYVDHHGLHVDSLVIMRHLDTVHPTPRLFPDDEQALREVLEWIDLSSTAMALRVWLDRLAGRPSFAASFAQVGRPFDPHAVGGGAGVRGEVADH